ncbi:hypothetical protein B0H17DRAFT_1113604 [Mycena rosella]|uniref:F-box domain-containing protein n=1 Tax=Mycena rosella TaxID=1033263 RepID=A0AAD7BGX5_MYCRO|nr:hypothetical protein B0H17DRAFT_1113604 [Mycena rosella]
MVDVTSLQSLEAVALKISGLQLSERPEIQAPCDTQPYPVLKLPPEIVSEIFEHFLPGYPEFIPTDGILSPFLLCRICRQWRQIALSTPTLWRSIQIDDTESDDQLEHLKTWLARSGDCPLAISIIGNGSKQSLLLQAALLHCRRWEHIEICVSFEAFGVIQGDMPLLRHLRFGPTELPSELAPALTLFDRAPQLKSVILTGCFLPSILHLPWAQLTHLDGECLYEYECTEVFGQATNLVRCTIGVCSSAEPYTPLPVAHVLPHLRHLILFATDGDACLMMILDNVTLPALRTLRVAEPSLDTKPLDSLSTFISRSQCTLEELRIDDGSMPLTAYREAFPSIGTITPIPATDP